MSYEDDYQAMTSAQMAADDRRFEQDRHDRRTELLARMAAEIASGIIEHNGNLMVCSKVEDRDYLADTAVDIARRILAEVEK